MARKQNLQCFVERALAFAHAALDNPTDDRVTLARVSADEALERVRKMEFTLGEARQIVLLVAQLRAVLAVVARRTGPSTTPLRAAS
ncbi:MAG TPA: hypothetical protein VGL86_15840 [Polyangia bacterium]|jgi:hypothetical protein